MSWKKHFRIVAPVANPEHNPAGHLNDGGRSGGTSSKYASYLPEVYAGHPNRIQRYYQYDDMDRDSDIHAALDTIADFCTQSEEQSDSPFEIHYHEEANETEVKILKTYMTKWIKLNNFNSSLWFMFRLCIKNGDQFFLRDPETNEWLWIDHFNVELVKVDDSQGKKPDEYIIRNLDYNKQVKFATTKADPSQYRTPLGNTIGLTATARPAMHMASVTASPFSLPGDARDPRQQQNISESMVVDAKHVIHLSLSVGMDINWPFGQSILESVFKTYKQKQLLEDSIIIYRVQRAPERRVFYIDVGTMPPPKANAYIEKMKTEIHQRRIPNRTGGGASIMDAAYNPLAIMEDYFFAQTAEGRGSKVETLPGGDNLGEIGDLSFFNNKLMRGLRIPPSYLPGGTEDTQVAYNDGKLGAAMIQEFRFTKYCMRLQALLAPVFDREFKRYLRNNGIMIDSGLFELRFFPPQNFTKYRQIELDQAQMGVFSQVSEYKMMAERFKLKRFLNLTEDELLENERLWAEENADKLKKSTGSTPAESEFDDDLSSVGIRGGGPLSEPTDLGGEDFEDELGGEEGDEELGGEEEPVPAGGGPGGAL